MNGHDRAWYERRLTGFGASEAGALLGLSRWRSTRQVVEDKARQIIPDPDGEERLRLRVGRDMEPMLARYLVEVAGQRGLIRDDARFHRSSKLYRSHDAPFVITNVDGFVDDAMVELKTDAYGYEPWGAEDGDPAQVVPPVYYAQLQHGMAATGRRRALLLVLIGLGKRLLYDVPRDDDYVADLVEYEEPWWNAVVEARRRLAADPDASIDDLLPAYGTTPADAAAVRKKYPADDGLILPATAEQSLLLDQLRQAVVDVAAAEARQAAIEIQVIDAIGKAAGLSSHVGTVTFKKTADSVSIDWSAVAGELREFAEGQLHHPDVDAIIAAKTTTKEGSRRIYWPRSWKKGAGSDAG